MAEKIYFISEIGPDGDCVHTFSVITDDAEDIKRITDGMGNAGIRCDVRSRSVESYRIENTDPEQNPCEKYVYAYSLGLER